MNERSNQRGEVKKKKNLCDIQISGERDTF